MPLLIGILTILSTALWVFVANATSPTTSNGSLIVINLIYYLGTLFVSLAGAVTLVLYSVGTRGLKSARQGSTEAVHRPRIILLRSMRHGMLVAGTLCGIGLLNAVNLANPLNVILLISAAILTEVYLFGH